MEQQGLPMSIAAIIAAAVLGAVLGGLIFIGLVVQAVLHARQ